jgi:tetratricopeptide (TPR) repeat protein
MKLACAWIAAAILTPFSVGAQGQPSPEDLQRLLALADQVKAALQRGDLDAALRPASDLMSGIVTQRKAAEPSPQEKLANLEQTAATNGKERFYALSGLAKAAFDAGDFDKAERYARELLSAAPGYEKDWNLGNAIFFGNMVLGRVALRRDHNVGLAKTLLMTSATTTGSPQLNSFGPNMSLANDLLIQGERETVLEFFSRCRAFWKMGATRLDNWTAVVKGGGTPDFGANLLY